MDVLTKPRVTKPTKSLLRLVHARGHTVNIGSLMFVFYWERFTWHVKSPFDNSHEIRRMHQKLQVDTNPIYQRLIRKLRQPSQTAGEVHSNPKELEHTEPRDNRRRNCAFKFFFFFFFALMINHWLFDRDDLVSWARRSRKEWTENFQIFKSPYPTKIQA